MSHFGWIEVSYSLEDQACSLWEKLVICWFENKQWYQFETLLTETDEHHAHTFMSKRAEEQESRKLLQL